MKTYRSLTWFWFFSLITSGSTAAQEAAKLPQVPVARPAVREVTDYEVFTGRTEAVSRVDLRCRVSGYLLKAPFREGAEVKKGDLLFEIDPRPYRAEMDRADAARALAEARFKLADANHKRATALQNRGAMSAEEFAKIAAERTEAEAAVRAARAGCAVARLNMEFTRVVAPISGRIGRRLIDPGNVVKADDTHLAVLVSLEPMYVYFDVDERSYLRLRRSFRDGGNKVTVGIGLAEEHGFRRQGTVDFIDNLVDPATGSLRLRAVLANKDELLTPGMFVRIRLALGSPRKALLVPARAIMIEEGERFVLVVNDKNIVEARPVKLGQEYEGLRVVETGLKAEDRVVTGGLAKLGPGMTVQPRLEKLPEKQPADLPDEGGGSAVLSPRGLFGPGILVEASYPGANATVISDAVRGPMEQMVGGLERLWYMRSRCTDDGKLTIALRFARGVDLHKAQILTQNRVNLALPLVPEAVKQAGVSVVQGTSPVPLIVNVVSPTDRFDRVYLGGYASVYLKDELARLAGVGEVKLIGDRPYALRVWLDPEKLAQRKVNADEVTSLLAKEKAENGPDGLEKLVLATDAAGRTIYLRDVARIEPGAGRSHSEALLDGKASAALVIYSTGEKSLQDLSAGIRRRLADLRRHLPEGLALETIFDFSDRAEYLLLDLDTPLKFAAESTDRLLSRCNDLLRLVPGVEHVLALSWNPFDLFGSGPCVLVRLKPAEQRQKVIDAMRTRLAGLEEATVRIRDLSQPGLTTGCAYPIDLALDGPEAMRVRAWASELGNRLGQSNKLTDVWINRDNEPRMHRFADVDRETAAARGVSLTSIMTTLQVYLGAQHVGNFNAFGRRWPVEVQADTGSGIPMRDLRQAKIRNSQGEMVPLSVFVKLRETTRPSALHFLDGRPMVEITANPASGVSVGQARRLCEAAAEAARKDLGLSTTYRLSWLQGR